jgi:hypothetical protein
LWLLALPGSPGTSPVPCHVSYGCPAQKPEDESLWRTRSSVRLPSANGNRPKMAAVTRPRLDYDRNVFINCPFDPAYQPLFAAIIFTIQYSGFFTRSALEVSDGTRTRLVTLCELIAGCRYGIHDLSHTSLDLAHGLPRMNMPFELGLFLGCQRC